mgnify:CR=1 FL=1
MKCPRCSHDNALLLLNSHLCINFTCDNFDSQHAMEYDRKQVLKQQILLDKEDPLDIAMQEYLKRKLQIHSVWLLDES